MNHRLYAVALLTITLVAIGYLLFLLYALTQMKQARADGMAKVDAILDQMKTEHDG